MGWASFYFCYYATCFYCLVQLLFCSCKQEVEKIGYPNPRSSDFLLSAFLLVPMPNKIVMESAWDFVPKHRLLMSIFRSANWTTSSLFSLLFNGPQSLVVQVQPRSFLFHIDESGRHILTIQSPPLAYPAFKVRTSDSLSIVVDSFPIIIYATQASTFVCAYLKSCISQVPYARG